MACGSVVYVVLCKIAYNQLLASEEEQFSDALIAKTLVLALVSALLAHYVFQYYKRVRIPGQSAPPPIAPAAAPVAAPLFTSSRRISSLVPGQSAAF